MRIVLSYAKSHIYELHAILAASITFFSMFIIKKPVKHYIRDFVDRKASRNEKWKELKSVYLKRCNMFIILITMLLSFSIFFIVSLISPLIEFSIYSAILSGIFALTEYALYDQFIATKGERNE